jgi:geranylgeranyl diphosphate synthase type II
LNANLSRSMEKNTAMVDAAMEKLLAPTPDLPESIRKAMRYSLFAGGKRLRPTLVLEAAA